MDELTELLQRLGLLAQAQNRQQAGEAGLQAVHIDVLRYLSRCNRYSNTPAALGRYLNTTKGTISQSVKVLEREKLISKLADTRDGRVVRLRLLQKGERLLRRAEQASVLQQAVDTLPDQEREGLRAGLAEVLRQAQRLNNAHSFGVCRSCRFFTRLETGKFQCGVTGEALSADDAERICVEHEGAA